jgi:hypothetical protein
VVRLRQAGLPKLHLKFKDHVEIATSCRTSKRRDDLQ